MQKINLFNNTIVKVYVPKEILDLYHPEKVNISLFHIPNYSRKLETIIFESCQYENDNFKVIVESSTHKSNWLGKWGLKFEILDVSGNSSCTVVQSECFEYVLPNGDYSSELEINLFNMAIPSITPITEREMVAISDELKLLTRPYIGMRVYLKSVNRTIIVTNLDDKGVVSGYSTRVRDDIDDELQLYFPLSVTFDMVPSTKPEINTGLVDVILSNFKVTVSDREVDKFTVTINGDTLTGSQLYSGFIDIIDSDKNYIIVTEAEGLFSYQERKVEFEYPTYIFFSEERDPKLVSLEGKRNPGSGLICTEEWFVNSNDSDGAYLWIVSPSEVNYVVANESLSFYIEGSTLYNANNLYYWRSFSKLNSGKWNLTIR